MAPTPVTRGFLIKTVLSMVGLIAAMLLFSFQAGGWFGNYSKLSKIPVSDIEKAVNYSVHEQKGRIEFYREYMRKNDLANQDHTFRITNLEQWRTETKQDLKEIKASLVRIEKKLE